MTINLTVTEMWIRIVMHQWSLNLNSQSQRLVQVEILVKCKSKQNIDEEKQENQLIPISCLSVKLHKPQT